MGTEPKGHRTTELTRFVGARCNGLSRKIGCGSGEVTGRVAGRSPGRMVSGGGVLTAAPSVNGGKQQHDTERGRIGIH